MIPQLVPCVRCARHIRVGVVCPFCARTPLAGVAFAMALGACRPEAREVSPRAPEAAVDASALHDAARADDVETAHDAGDAGDADGGREACDGATTADVTAARPAFDAARARRRQRDAADARRQMREQMREHIPCYGAPFKP